MDANDLLNDIRTLLLPVQALQSSHDTLRKLMIALESAKPMVEGLKRDLEMVEVLREEVLSASGNGSGV
ncbi:hypothetical protein HDU76_012888 [Blyttiomyces sp. JEL0837]|nr:hypothetical protein HDU76_012888 [Blyttiomyces sp. JEL0837]